MRLPNTMPSSVLLAHDLLVSATLSCLGNMSLYSRGDLGGHPEKGADKGSIEDTPRAKQHTHVYIIVYPRIYCGMPVCTFSLSDSRCK